MLFSHTVMSWDKVLDLDLENVEKCGRAIRPFSDTYYFRLRNFFNFWLLNFVKTFNKSTHFYIK